MHSFMLLVFPIQLTLQFSKVALNSLYYDLVVIDRFLLYLLYRYITNTIVYICH